MLVPSDLRKLDWQGALRETAPWDKGGLFRRSGCLRLFPPSASEEWVRERPRKRQRARLEWVFGEMFQSAAGFPHIGSGQPEVGVGDRCAGVRPTLSADLEVGRWERWLSGAGMGQDLPEFHKQQGKPGQE